MCYIAETPSTTTNDYQESYSYLHFDHPSQHATITDRRSFLAHSNTFHRGCVVDDYLIYCLKLERTTGQVTLSHAGPNSIYNYETISYRFAKSELDLNELNYIQLSAGSQQVPIRNLIVCFHTLPDLHPLFEKNFQRTSIATSQPKAHSSASSHPSAASKGDKSPGILSQAKNAVLDFMGYDFDPKKLKPCPDSINCLRQALDDHCKKYSHPCRFSELCRNKDKEPHLTHEPQQVDKCISDTSCGLLNDPYHRAKFRHTDRPYFLIPCRDQLACRDRSSKHRIKYSHGEQVNRNTAAAVEKAQKPFSTSILSSESYSQEQQKMVYHGSHDEKTPCRHGLKCYDKNISRHCSRYSHPPEQQPRSNVDQNHLPISHPSGSVGYQANNSNHYSQNSYADVQRHKPQEIDYHQKRKCPLGIECRNYDTAHWSEYSHSSK